MARYGINIEKSIAFRGGVQHFGNTYYYEGPIPNTANLSLEGLVDQLVVLEKAQHGNNITFTRGRLWSADGTKAENQMIVDKPLTGTGAVAINVNMDRERAFLIQFRAGVDSRGRPVYLRKWFHLLASTLGGVAISSDMLSQNSGLATAQKTALENFGNSFKQLIQDGTPMNLVAKSGRQITGATTAHPFLEHHQLGEEWRGL